MSKIPLSEFLNVDFVFVETGETAESAIKKLEEDLRKGNSGNTLYAISTSNPQLQAVSCGCTGLLIKGCFWVILLPSVSPPSSLLLTLWFTNLLLIWSLPPSREASLIITPYITY